MDMIGPREAEMVEFISWLIIGDLLIFVGVLAWLANKSRVRRD